VFNAIQHLLFAFHCSVGTLLLREFEKNACGFVVSIRCSQLLFGPLISDPFFVGLPAQPLGGDEAFLHWSLQGNADVRQSFAGEFPQLGRRGIMVLAHVHIHGVRRCQERQKNIDHHESKVITIFGPKNSLRNLGVAFLLFFEVFSSLFDHFKYVFSVPIQNRSE